MPRVAYSLEEKQRLRQELVAVALELMAKQGIQHTTVEQIYQKVGISRSFFYSFFPTKEDLVVEALYLQQPRILAYAKKYPVQFIHAPEDRILEAREILARKGIYCEHTTAANYAAYLAQQDQGNTVEDCLITMCGAGLKSDY